MLRPAPGVRFRTGSSNDCPADHLRRNLCHDPRQACGYVDDHAREFVSFDSPACLLGHLATLRRSGDAVPRRILFADYDDGSLHPAESMSFLLTRRLPTVMQSGVLTFRSAQAAARARTDEAERITDWLGFRTARDEPDRVVEVSVGPEGMRPERIFVDKGELLALRLTDAPDGRVLQHLDRKVRNAPRQKPLDGNDDNDFGRIGLHLVGNVRSHGLAQRGRRALDSHFETTKPPQNGHNRSPL